MANGQHPLILGNLQWEIKTADLSPKQIFQNMQAAKEKQSIYWSLPAGMNKEQAANWITALDFAGKGSPSTLTKPSIFRRPDDFIKHLRYLSYRGKQDTDRMDREEAGKTKIIWGNPETVPVVLGERKMEEVKEVREKQEPTKQEQAGKQLSDANLTKLKESKARKNARRLIKRQERKAAKRAETAAILAELRQEEPQTKPILRVDEFKSASEASKKLTRKKYAHIKDLLNQVYPIRDRSNPIVKASLPALKLPWTAKPLDDVWRFSGLQ